MVLFYQFIQFWQEKFGKILGNIRILLYLCGRMGFARENRLRLSNSSKLDCIRLALSLPP